MIEEEHQTISGPVSQQSSRSHRDRQSLCCEEAGKFLNVDVYVVSPLASSGKCVHALAFHVQTADTTTCTATWYPTGTSRLTSSLIRD